MTTSIPECKREHSVAASENLLAPGLVAVDSYLDIRAGSKNVTEIFELTRERLEVVELAVADADEIPGFIADRLMTRSQIDNA